MDDRVLDQWQSWALGLSKKPKLIAPIAGGLTNQSFLIEVDGQNMVLRCNSSNSAALGINRLQEKIILEKVSALGISPKVYCCDIEAGICLSEFVGEQYWEDISAQQMSKRQRLLAAVEQIHEVECDLPARDYQKYINHYWQGVQGLDINLADDICREREFLLSVVDDFSSEPAVLTHHDLITNNVIDTKQQLYVLDWEYASMGQGEFDIATLMREWNLSVQDLNGLNYSRDKLNIALRLYDHIYQLWYFLQK